MFNYYTPPTFNLYLSSVLSQQQWRRNLNPFAKLHQFSHCGIRHTIRHTIMSIKMWGLGKQIPAVHWIGLSNSEILPKDNFLISIVQNTLSNMFGLWGFKVRDMSLENRAIF